MRFLKLLIVLAGLLLALPAATARAPQTETRLTPADLVYRGAFRLPPGPPDEGWEYSGAALAYNPGGDPSGPADGYPGSLFATGHNWYQRVAEITIPEPVISPAKNPADLNTAAFLQPFTDIRGDLYREFEIPRAALVVLPALDDQTTPKLVFAWGQHMDEESTASTHGWRELDLAGAPSVGTWHIQGLHSYVTNDYLFAIPPAWAAQHAPGVTLATGRFRDGGQGAQGPSLIALTLPNSSDPPAPESALPALPLLLYNAVDEAAQHMLTGYHHADEWTGGAWLTAGERGAVIFVGTKGIGECWYGFANGTVWPDEPPYPEVPEDGGRGWWSTEFAAQMLFYDPADLAAVARGELAPFEPQPYAVMDLDPFLYNITGTQQKEHVGAVDFDAARGLLYVVEPLADGDQSLIHVWAVNGEE